MDEAFRIIGENDTVEGIYVSHKIGEAVVSRGRDFYIALPATALKHDNDVFLQDIIILKSLVSRFK